MGRRLPRRMWHTAAALVPLPLIALGYVAAVPGNPIRFQIELLFSGHGSAQPLTHTAEVAPAAPSARGRDPVPHRRQGPAGRPISRAEHRHLRRQAAHRREPRRRRCRHDRRAQRRSEANAALKADRLKPTTSVALRGPVTGPDSGDADERGRQLALHVAARRRWLPALGRGDRLPSDARGPGLPLSGREPGRVRAARAPLSRHRHLFRGARRAGQRPGRRRPGHHESGAEPALPRDDLRRGLSGPDAEGLPVLLHLRRQDRHAAQRRAMGAGPGHRQEDHRRRALAARGRLFDLSTTPIT